MVLGGPVRFNHRLSESMKRNRQRVGLSVRLSVMGSDL
jgi:hypothetical protein